MRKAPFSYFFKMGISEDGQITLKVEDHRIVSTIAKGEIFKMHHQIPAMRAFPRLRCFIKKQQMRKVWLMALNGRFENYIRAKSL